MNIQTDRKHLIGIFTDFFFLQVSLKTTLTLVSCCFPLLISSSSPNRNKQFQKC